MRQTRGDASPSAVSLAFKFASLAVLCVAFAYGDFRLFQQLIKSKGSHCHNKRPASQ